MIRHWRLPDVGFTPALRNPVGTVGAHSAAVDTSTHPSDPGDAAPGAAVVTTVFLAATTLPLSARLLLEYIPRF